MYLKGSGGCGIQFMRKKYNCFDIDQHPHNKNVGEGKIVYLLGDPFDVVRSLDRRGFLHPAIKQVEGLIEKRDDIWGSELWTKVSLEEYLSYGMDFLDLEGHYNYYRSLPNESIFVRYEALKEPETYDILDDFIGHKSTLEKLADRNTYDDLDDQLLSQMELIYGNWRDKYYNLPLISIKK
jgi:hypothetical protein